MTYSISGSRSSSSISSSSDSNSNSNSNSDSNSNSNSNSIDTCKNLKQDSTDFKYSSFDSKSTGLVLVSIFLASSVSPDDDSGSAGSLRM